MSDKVTNIETDPVDELECTQCGQPFDVSECESFSEVACPACETVHRVPVQLGNFRLLRLLGTGGMGGVYEALDTSLNRPVAIKVMLASLGDDLDFLDTFKREAQAAAALNHPNVAQIYTYGQAKGQPYIVMELVSGKQFKDLVQNSAPLDPMFVMTIGHDIADGLRAAADNQLYHGDVKPENILLDEKGQGKLVDFGLAAMADRGQAGIWGTPYYIAPEKLTKSSTDERSDIYSLGATLYHALAGEPPFDGDTPIEVVKARLHKPARDITALNPRVDKKIARVIHRMLEKETGSRYPNYGSLIRDMKKLIDEFGEVRSPSGGKGTSGKIVMTKKRSPTMITPAGSSSSGKRTSPSKRSSASKRATYKGRSPKGTTVRKDETRDVKKKKKKSNLVVPIVFGIVIILVAVGISFAVISEKNKREEARRADLAAAQETQKNAKTLMADMEARIENALGSAAAQDGARAEAESIAEQHGSLTEDANIVIRHVKEMVEARNNVRGIKTTSATTMKLITEAQDSATANRGYAELWDQHLKLKELEVKLQSITPKIKAQIETMRSKRDKIIADKKAKEKAERDKKIAADKAKREKEERARKDRLARENKAKDEKRLTDLTATVKQKYLPLNQFDLAVNEIERVRNEFKVPDYKAKVLGILERYTRLRDTKQGIVDGLERVVPNTGNVINGQAITAVTPQAITLREQGSFAFERMNPTMLLQLIGYSIKLARGEPEKQADYFLAAAVYKYELDEQDEKFDLFLEQAVKGNPKLLDKMPELLPGAAMPAAP